MRRLVTGLLAATSLGIVSAQAADLPIKGPVYPAPPLYSWTGCRLGLNAGGVWGTSNINIPLYPSNFNVNPSSFIGGGQMGCDYQWQQVVIGLEGDFDGMSLSGNGLTGGAAAERFGVKWNWEASIRGRLGWTPIGSPWLFYATGGATWANLSNANFTPGLTVTNGQSGTPAGWTVGGGVEYQFTPNWIFGVEYRYSQYQTNRYVFVGPVDVNLKTNTVMAKVNYLFHL
ncbi:MAG TPA: outer membrane protein [Pseudolabrys sp.]|nr:outer membrane protein [Pseudolabrys sp.]